MKETMAGILPSVLDFLKSIILSFKQEHFILSDCKVSFDSKVPFSEIDELNFCLLNNNQGYGHILIELSLEMIKNPYTLFYLGCLSLRTDKGVVIKIDRPSSFKEFVSENYSKVNKDGNLVLGIEYFFRSDDEKMKFMTCNSLCFDGYFALKRKKSAYGFVCRLDRNNANWCFAEGNTYRIYKYTNIQHLWH